MSGIPNNPLGSLGSLQNANTQLQNLMQNALAQSQATQASLLSQTGAYIGPPCFTPTQPNMTGTEFIKASLRVSMEREIFTMISLSIMIGSAGTVFCMILGGIVFYWTKNWPLGFMFGMPSMATGAVIAFFVRRKMKKWIEVHLS